MRDIQFSWESKVHAGDTVSHDDKALGVVTSVKPICSCRFIITVISSDKEEEELNKVIELYGVDKYKRHLAIKKAV